MTRMGKIDAALRAWEDLDESEKDAFEAIIYNQRLPQGDLLSAEQRAEVEELAAQLEAGTLEFATDDEVERFRAKYKS